MIVDKLKFYAGLGMLVVFTVLLVIMFLPVLDGKNALEYSDELYNSISKDSAYYIDDVKADSTEFDGTSVNVTIEMETEEQAEQTALLYQETGAEAIVSGAEVEVAGDLGRILETCLNDADDMYYNEGETIQAKYGYDERIVLYNWWESLEVMSSELEDQDLFDEAKGIDKALAKAIEPAYNYYGIEAESMMDRIGIVLFSLIFYVVYTLWYGFALMYMIEGWGLRISHMFPFSFEARVRPNY